MKAIKHITTLTTAAIAMIAMSSCSVEEAVIIAPEDVTERIDMVLEGEEPEYIYLQSSEGDPTADLVDYNFYGGSSNEFDFKVNLDDERTLLFKIYNETTSSPWEVEEGYSLFATQDHDDKQKYVTVEMVTGGEVPEFQSNYGSYPLGTYLNVFNIVDYNLSNNEIHCRIIDLPLVNVNDPSQSITINGTFRGSLSFID